MGKLFRALLVPLRALFRFIDPTRDTAQAALIRQIAVDLVRQYLARNPKAADTVFRGTQIIETLIRMFGIKPEIAQRVVESVFQEVTGKPLNQV